MQNNLFVITKFSGFDPKLILIKPGCFILQGQLNIFHIQLPETILLGLNFLYSTNNIKNIYEKYIKVLPLLMVSIVGCTKLDQSLTGSLTNDQGSALGSSGVGLLLNGAYSDLGWHFYCTGFIILSGRKYNR